MQGDHDPRHQIEADLHGKGLSEGEVGLFGGTVLGISSVAPAYALTATIGILVAEAGSKMPVIIIAGFLPMFFAAYAYREFNKVAPDCGTSFTWTTKAFGPYIGWLGGWAAILATIIVLSNLAGVAVQFFYQFLGDMVDTPSVSDLWENRLINVVTCLVFIAIATWIAYRGISTTERVQIVLVIFQLVVLGTFAIAAFIKAGESETGLSFSLDWFSPAGPHPVGLHRRTVRLDLRVLGLGHRAHRQRGVHRLRQDAGPGGAAVRRLDPADLPAGGGVPADVLRRGHLRPRAGQRGDRRQRLRRSRPARARPTARPGAVPGGARLQRREPDHHVPADLAHHAGDGQLPRVPEQVRDHPPRAQDPVVRDRRRRHRRRRLLLGAHLRQRARADRHDLLARHHDLLLLRADGVRVHLLLPQASSSRTSPASCSSCSSRCWAGSDSRGCSW